MSFSIGTGGLHIGPGWALELFGDRAEGRAFDRRIALRLLGFLRPYWQRMLAPVPPETYQNGAYWAVPVGWAAQTMSLEHPAEAEALVQEVLQVWREGEVY